MRYLQRRPGPPLSEYVELIWYCANYRAAHRREAVLPSGSTAFIVALAHSAMPNWSRDLAAREPASSDGPSLVAGIHTRYMVIDTAALDSLLGVHFRPAGAAAFLSGTPLDRFRELHVPLDAVWPRAAVAELRERAMSAPDPAAKLTVLEAALRARFNERYTAPPTVAFAVELLTRAPQADTVAQVARQTGLSARRLGELFHRHVGVPPKVYARLKRFQLAVRRMDEGREVRWAELSADCGFYDQSHFLNEFREFSGMSPQQYRAGRGAWRNHIVLD